MCEPGCRRMAHDMQADSMGSGPREHDRRGGPVARKGKRMATGERVLRRKGRPAAGIERCSLCHEPAPGHVPAAGCPFGGETGCPMVQPSADDPLAETIAYHEAPRAEADGFP